MLSRVADNLYWMARYLERTENIARLVDVSAGLMLDLPQRLSPGWQPLVKITGHESLYAQLEREVNEKCVVRFIVANQDNPGSMLSAIARAREIARTVRDILPREVWEHINELYLYVSEHAVEAATRRTRYGFLGRVTSATQALTGMFEGIFNEGDASSFLSLGRNIERADMTSRIVDVRAAAMMSGPSAAELGAFETVLWMGVLRSLSGYQMYRLKTRERVYGAGVVRFLLADEQFPRACVCCLRRAEDVLRRLPNSRPLQRRVARMRRAIHHTHLEQLEQGDLHEFIDRLQLSLGRTSDELARVYFTGRTAADQVRSRNQNKHITATHLQNI
ncbi:MAG TPA: alpha-E domain-containing protein [Steroidobacteraceae bacterium]